MAKEQDRYWVYTRDTDGDLVDNIGFFETLTGALEAAAQEMSGLADKDLLASTFIHVVDQKTGTTVWIAGPGNTIEHPQGWSLMDEPVS